MKTYDPYTIFNPILFSISTPMVNRLHDQITGWLWHGIIGGLILGDFRIGKTHAILRILDDLKTRSGEKVPSCFMSIATRDQKTIASIFRNLCRSFNADIGRNCTADAMAHYLLHALGEMSLVNKERRVVLIVDEFQRLSLRQLDAFAELYDQLSSVGVNLFVLFVGNANESTPLIKSILRKENELIKGRFFTVEYRHHGIRSHEELKLCLKQFDEEFMWDGKKTSLTRFFAGNRQGPSWKLASISKVFWRVYRNEFQPKLQAQSWGMQYFLAAVKTLLVDYLSENDLDSEEDLEDMIIHSVNVSGLIPSLVRSSQ